jgi:hypothetical protein
MKATSSSRRRAPTREPHPLNQTARDLFARMTISQQTAVLRVLSMFDRSVDQRTLLATPAQREQWELEEIEFGRQVAQGGMQ